MTKPLVKLLVGVGVWLVLMARVASNPAPIQAAQCGMNIDPSNPAGNPSGATLQGTTWVRMTYFDCTTANPPTQSLDMYRSLLSQYGQVLLIINSQSYPGGWQDLEGLASRVECILSGCEGVEGIGGLVDAVEIWNEPDLSHMGNLSAADYAQMVNKLAPVISSAGKTVVVGALGSGKTDYAQAMHSAITVPYDALSIHPYGKSVNGVGGTGFGDMAESVAAYKSITGKPVWITEIGDNTSPSPEAKADYLRTIYGSGVGAEVIMWFAWSDGMVPGFGITDAGQKPIQPLYSAYQNMCGVSDNITTNAAIDPPGEACGGPGTSPGETIPDDYYLYPIDGLLDHYLDDNGNRVDVLESERRLKTAESLVKQGYEVHCTTPKISAILQQTNGELFTTNHPTNTDPMPATLISEQIYDYTDVTIPLWRNGGNQHNLFADLENYWSFYESNPSGSAKSDPSIYSAPIYSLLTKQEQCFQEVWMLKTIDQMCSKLDDPASCALHQNIPDSQYTTQDLYQTIGRPETVEQITQYCARVSDPNTNIGQEVQTAIQNTPLFLDKAYRLGFVVVAAELTDEPGPFKFNFLRFWAPEGTSTPNAEVRIIAFKLPDFATNKDFADPEGDREFGSDIYYQDALQLTRSVLQTQDQQQTNKREMITRKKTWLERLRNPNLVTQPPSLWCGGENCNLPISGAIIDLINAGLDYTRDDGHGGYPPIVCDGGAPEGLLYDPVNEITDSGVLHLPAGQETNTLGQMLETLKQNTIGQLFKDSEGAESSLPFKFLSQIDMNPHNTPRVSARPITSYLVIPQGYDLRDVEDTLAGAFFTSDQIKGMRFNPEIPQYLKLDGIDQSFDSTEQGIKFNITTDPKCIDGSLTKEEYENICIQEANTSLESATSQEEHQPRLFGGFLGYLMRQIQKSLHPQDSAAHDYISSCQTTEDFLLGRCSGEPAGARDSTSGSQVTNLAYMNQEVATCTLGRGITPGGNLNVTEYGQQCTVANSVTGEIGQAVAMTPDLEIPNWRRPDLASEQITCNQELFSFIACTFNPSRGYSNYTLIAHRVDANGNFKPQGEMTACEYVTQRTTAAGISPRFALSIWGEESGFSSAGEAYDFGVAVGQYNQTSRQASSIGPQLTGFLNSIRGSDSYTDFMVRYSGEPPVHATAGEFCLNPSFPVNVKDFYNYLEGF